MVLLFQTCYNLHFQGWVDRGIALTIAGPKKKKEKQAIFKSVLSLTVAVLFRVTGTPKR